MTPVVRTFSDLEEIEGVHLKPVEAADLQDAQKRWLPLLRDVAAEYYFRGESQRVWRLRSLKVENWADDEGCGVAASREGHGNQRDCRRFPWI
jgi:hypothetical protein